MAEKNVWEIVMRRGLVMRDVVQVNNFKDIFNAVNVKLTDSWGQFLEGPEKLWQNLKPFD